MTFIACTDQHQFCYPNPSSDGSCTPLTGSDYIGAAIDSMSKTDVQTEISMRIFDGLSGNHILDVASSRGSSSLRAQEAVSLGSGSISIPLPNDQWMIECRSWFNTALAKLQRSVVDYATGPAHEGYMHYITQDPESDAWQQVCRSQRVKNPGGFQNFSLLGVTLILALGTVVILLGLTIDKIVGLVQRVFFPRAYGRLAWALDSKFQLQRMAFEGAGWNQWDVGTSEDVVPITKPDTQVGSYTRFDGEWATVVRPRDDELLMGSTIVIGKTERI